MAFPPSVLPVGLSALADVLGDRHDATIASSQGQYELRFGDPSTLIVVLSPTRADFFEDVERALALDVMEDDDPAHLPLEELSVQEGVELAVHTIEEILGLYVEADVEDVSVDGEDDADRQARAVLSALLADGSIELVGSRSRPGVEGKLAHLLAHDASVDAMLDALVDHPGVAEIYADEQQLEALLAASKRRRR